MAECRPHLRIAMLLPDLGIGGAEEVACTLARYLANDRCRCVVGALYDGGLLETALREQETPVAVLRLSRRPCALPWFVTDMVRMWRELARFLRQHEINVIQTNNLVPTNFLVLLLARRLHIPAVTFNFHSERFLPKAQKGSLKNRFHRLAYRLARRWTSDYVAVSSEVKQSMLRAGDCGSRRHGDLQRRGCRAILPAGRSLVGETALGVGDDAKLLITVGRLCAAKGHRYLIDAAPTVSDRHPNAHFLFVGDGELRGGARGTNSSLRHVGADPLFGKSPRCLQVAYGQRCLRASFPLGGTFHGAVGGHGCRPADRRHRRLRHASAYRERVHRFTDFSRQFPRSGWWRLDTVLSGLGAQDADGGIRRMGEAGRGRVRQQFSAEHQAADYLTLYDHLVCSGMGHQ